MSSEEDKRAEAMDWESPATPLECGKPPKKRKEKAKP